MVVSTLKDCLLVMYSPSKMIRRFVKNAVITPSVDFYRLEEVFVLTSSSVSAPPKPGLEPKLVPQTQRDQVEGAKGAVKP